MKAKNYTHTTLRISNRRGEGEPLPFELGTHLFAIIRRNLLAGKKPAPTPDVQLTFAL